MVFVAQGLGTNNWVEQYHIVNSSMFHWAEQEIANSLMFHGAEQEIVLVVGVVVEEDVLVVGVVVVVVVDAEGKTVNLLGWDGEEWEEGVCIVGVVTLKEGAVVAVVHCCWKDVHLQEEVEAHYFLLLKEVDEKEDVKELH